MNRCIVLLLALLMINYTSQTNLCKVTNLQQSFDIGGIYFRVLPNSWCKPANVTSFIEFRIHPIGSSPRSPPQLISLDDDDDTLRSMFNPQLPTAVYIHGFFEGAKASSVRAFRQEFIIRKDYNLMTVNWQELANAPWYPSAVRAYPVVGGELVKLLDRLIALGLVQLDTLHLLGFSLGAHICGLVGNKLKSGRPARITALDPALPLIGFMPRSMQLQKSAANFVDVIHTCAGLYGLSKPVGHVDFYPNGGLYIQPGCAITLAPITCSHWRSWRFFIESMHGGEFISTKCESWESFRLGKCDANEKILMGINVNQTARGSFYLKTNWEPPFALLK